MGQTTLVFDRVDGRSREENDTDLPVNPVNRSPSLESVTRPTPSSQLADPPDFPGRTVGHPSKNHPQPQVLVRCGVNSPLIGAGGRVIGDGWGGTPSEVKSPLYGHAKWCHKGLERGSEEPEPTN